MPDVNCPTTMASAGPTSMIPRPCLPGGVTETGSFRSARRSTLYAIVGSLLGFGTAGCSALSGAVDSMAELAGFGPLSRPKWRNVALVATEDANGNTPVAVDLVLVTDVALAEALSATPAAKWFRSRADLQRTFPGKLVVISHELVPRQAITIGRNQFGDIEALGAFMFADFGAPGEHRQRLRLEARGLVVRLELREFTVIEVKGR